MRWRSPSSVKLHVCIKQRDDGRRRDPPAADSGPDQSFLLVVADHLDEPWAVLSVGLLHKALQVVFELPCEQKKNKKPINTDALFQNLNFEGGAAQSSGIKRLYSLRRRLTGTGGLIVGGRSR